MKYKKLNDALEKAGIGGDELLTALTSESSFWALRTIDKNPDLAGVDPTEDDGHMDLLCFVDLLIKSK